MIKNYIGGMYRLCEGDTLTTSVINPYDDSVYGTIPLSDPGTVNQAVEVARMAQSAWQRLGRIQRATLLIKIANRLNTLQHYFKELIRLETGKTLNESMAEVNEAVHMFEVAASIAKQPIGQLYASEVSSKEVLVERKPRGVVGIISPWNFPLAIGGAWNAAPALAEGNTVVWKPSEHTPLVADKLAELIDNILPAGVFNVIHGVGTTGSCLAYSNVDVVLFTGSVPTGQKIRKACAESLTGKIAACETGSKSGVIVCVDANLDLAVDACVASAFKTSGQRCVSAGRIFVHEKVYQKFVSMFIDRARGLKYGKDYGPIISQKQKDNIKKYGQMVADDSDATILLDGGVVPQFGSWLPPFVYEVARWNSTKKYLVEEVFGPHVAIIPWVGLEEVVDFFNDTQYGLAAGVITNDFRNMKYFRENLDVGMLYINGGSIGGESHIPFGGVKASGNGWKVASATHEIVTHRLATTINYEDKIQWAQGMK